MRKKAPKRSTGSKQSARLAMNKDLKRSGLLKKQYDQMMVEPLSREETYEQIGQKKLSYRIPYVNADNQLTTFARYRFLEESGNSYKYSQKYGTRSHLYLVPGAPHQEVFSDPSRTIYITEGEKKATVAWYSYDIYTIGLGGVSSYQSKNNMIYLSDDFDQIIFEGRDVVLVPDNDIKTNENVAREIFSLGHQLYKRKANVFIKYLPNE